MKSRFLHLSEKNVRLYAFRNKAGLFNRGFKNIFSGSVLYLHSEIFLGVEDTYNIVAVLAAKRIVIKSCGVDDLIPILKGIIDIECFNLCSVSEYLINRRIVEIKDVLYHFALVRLDSSLFGTRADHKLDLVLGYFLFLVGIYAEKTEDTVCGCGEQPHKRRKNTRNESEKSRKSKSCFFRVVHSYLFGNELAYNDTEIRNDNRDNNHHYLFKYLLGDHCHAA